MTTKIRSFLIKYASGLCVATVLFGCAKPAEKILSRSNALMNEGKYLEAAGLLKELTVLYPNNAQVWNQLGVAYHQYGDLVAATHAYTAALKLSNTFSIAHYNLGCALFEMRNYLQASREFASYVMYEPQSVDGWIKLGSSQLYLGQYEAAEKSFRAALSLNPQSYEAYNGLGISVFYLKRWKESLQYFSNAIKIKQDYGPANLNLAVVLLSHQKDRENAVKIFKRFLMLRPQSPYHAMVSNLLSKLETPQQSNTINRIETIQTNIIKQQLSLEQKTNDSRTIELLKLKQPDIIVDKQSTALVHGVKEIQKPINTAETQTRTSSVPEPAGIPTNKERNSIVEVKPTVIPASTSYVTKIDSEIPVVITLPTNPPQQTTQISNTGQEKKKQISNTEPDFDELQMNSGQTNLESRSEKSGWGISFLQKINPFKKKSTTQPIITPLPSVSKAEESTGAEGPKEVKKMSGELKKLHPATVADSNKEMAKTGTQEINHNLRIETRPEFPRYKYRNPSKPKEGNISEAQNQFKLGLEDHEAGNLIEAKVHYGEAIKANPAFYEATYNLALICFQHNEIERALELYEYALAINPDAVNARLNFAIALQKANYIYDAVNEYENYLKVNPNDTRVHILLANLYARQLKDRDKAANHYMEVLRLEPTHPQALAIHQWLKENLK